MVDLVSGSIVLGYAFAGLGYLIGLLLLSSPFTSKSMKIKGNEMMEYSIICSLYLSLSYVVLGLSNTAYNIISSNLGGNLIGGGTLKGVADYYYEQWSLQLLGFFGALAIPLGASLIPLVGAVVSLVLLVAMSPFVLLFGLTTTVYFSIAIIFYIFNYLTPIFFFLGSALIPAPLKFGKKIGGLLIASALVFTALGPAIPTIADIISKNAFSNIAEEIKKGLSGFTPEQETFIRVYTGYSGNPFIDSLKKILDPFLSVPYAFAFSSILAMLFLTVAIEGLSEQIGGAGEKIIEV